MKQQIPKVARDLLARQMPADAHPSPDLLNGYLEQQLAADEKTRVAGHLAACAECREVVFLASAAGEEDRAAVSRQERPVAATPRLAWLSWKWTVPAVAVLVVASGLVVERDRILTPGHPLSQTLAMNQQPAAPSEAVTAPKTLAKSAAPPPASNASKEMMAKKSAVAPPVEQKPVAKALPSSMADRAANQPLARKEAVLPPASTGASESLAAGSLTAPRAQNELRRAPARAPSESAETSAAVPSATAGATQSGAAVSRDPSTDAMKAGFAKANGGNDIQLEISDVARALVDHSNWRITAAGHLERSTGPGTWTRVLATQRVVFHSVGIVGTDVWAGGNNGALFHSADAGEHWNKVALTADGHTERAAIVSIHFDTAQQGTVRSDSGATWSTADGGQAWTKQ